MIQNESILKVCDNSGAKLVKCIKILGFSKKKYAKIGDFIKVSVKKIFFNNSKVKKGDVYNSLVIRTIYKYNRFNGSFLSFNDNSVLLLNSKNDVIGSRIFGPIPKELRNISFFLKKLNSLSPYYI